MDVCAGAGAETATFLGRDLGTVGGALKKEKDCCFAGDGLGAARSSIFSFKGVGLPNRENESSFLVSDTGNDSTKIET